MEERELAELPGNAQQQQSVVLGLTCLVPFCGSERDAPVICINFPDPFPLL